MEIVHMTCLTSPRGPKRSPGVPYTAFLEGNSNLGTRRFGNVSL